MVADLNALNTAVAAEFADALEQKQKAGELLTVIGLDIGPCFNSESSFRCQIKPGFLRKQAHRVAVVLDTQPSVLAN